MSPDALAHGLPFRHGAEAEPWIAIGLVFAGVFAVVVTGLWLSRLAQASVANELLAAAFAAGALLFLFFDLLKESAGLGQGLIRNPLLQLLLVAAFAVGALAIALIHERRRDPLVLAWLWLLGISAHGAGEGWIVGTEAATADITAPLQATSFLLHKAAEAFTIPLVAGVTLSNRTILAMAATMAVIALISSVGGLLLSAAIAPMVFFAVGAGAAGFAILRLGARFELTFQHMSAAVLGVFFVYVAGVLHEF